MHVHALPLEVVIDVVNGWSPTAREAAGITEHPPPLASLLTPHGVGIVPGDADLDDELVAGWADRLHGMFAGPGSEQRLAALNAAIERLDPLPEVTATGPAWRVATDDLALPAALVLALAEHARSDPGLDRLGICAAHRCVDAFADTSQARSRRYCSITCQNRAKTAARRARLRRPDASR